MSLKKTIWGTKMLKLSIIIAILLISMGTGYARGGMDGGTTTTTTTIGSTTTTTIGSTGMGMGGGGSCNNAATGDIWTLNDDGDKQSLFNLSDDVNLGGGVFDPNTPYSYSILDDSSSIVGQGEVSTDGSGALVVVSIWTIQEADLGRTFTVKLTGSDNNCGGGSCCGGGTTATTTFSAAGPASEIPEYPTVIIPAIMAFGGYMVIRSRRRRE